MRYSLHRLENMATVPNIDTVIEQVDAAATKATEYLRRYGMSLPGGSDTRPPMLDEVDQYLRSLVAEAYDGFVAAREEAMAAPLPVNDDQIDGYGTDDKLFDVTLTGLEEPRGHLTTTIALRLIG